MNTGANMAQQVNQASAIQRAQEQLNAQGQLVNAQNAQAGVNQAIGNLAYVLGGGTSRAPGTSATATP